MQVEGILAEVFGVRMADRQRGLEGSRLIHPASPFAKGERREGIRIYGEGRRSL
jgi:hypothetical protein